MRFALPVPPWSVSEGRGWFISETLFENSVVLYGSKTESDTRQHGSQFENSVVLYGSKTIRFLFTGNILATKNQIP